MQVLPFLLMASLLPAPLKSHIENTLAARRADPEHWQTTPLPPISMLVEPARKYEELKELESAYKIEIVTACPTFPVKTTYGAIDGAAADDESLEPYAGLFSAEFGLYPTNLIKRAQLKRVVLCKNLSYIGQRRGAIPDWEHDTLYLDVEFGAHSKPYLRKAIHHEFFHIIDFRDDGMVYQDERWSSLNPTAFRYGNGGKSARGNGESVLTDKYPGFLNHYSTTGVEEDKAEVFANMIVDYAYVQNRALNDRVIKAKVERMRELLASFCPEMNAKFWENAKKVERTDD